MNWNNEQLDKALLELAAKEYTQTLMAKRLYADFPELFPSPPTRDMVKSALAKAKERAFYLSDSPLADPTPYLTKYECCIKGDELIAKNYSLLSSIMAKQKRKMFVISDLHIPHMDEAKFEKAVELNRSADMCIIGGDFLDGYSISRWRKEKDAPFQFELDQGIRVLEYLSKVFPWVRIIRGNHDERAVKIIRDSLPPSLLFLIDDDPLSYITRPFSNIEYIDHWYTQIGDTIIAHQERSSGYEGRPPVLLHDYFETKGWARRLGLDPIRLYITGHNHQVGAVYKEGRKFIECGCMAETMDYSKDAKAVMRPPLTGYVSVVQYGGQSDFNESREYLV